MIEKWISQMRKGTLELCLLLLLRSRERYGYEIVQSLSDRTIVDAGESTVYPILARLKAAGYLRQRTHASSSGPPRNYYSLSAKGQIYLESLLCAWDELHTGVNSMRTDRQVGGDTDE